MNKRIVVASLLIALLITGMVMGQSWSGLLQAGIVAIQSFIQTFGTVGWIAVGFVLVLISVSGVLPASMAGIIAGAAYGLPLGFALSALSTMVGAWLAFRLSRSMFRPMIIRLLSGRPRLQVLDRALARDGWRMVWLLRISPIMPFAATSYTLGLSSIRDREYMIGTVASLPALGLYVFLGTLADAGVSAMRTGAGPLRYGVLLAGVVTTALITLRIGQIAIGLMETSDNPSAGPSVGCLSLSNQPPDHVIDPGAPVRKMR